MYVYTNDLENTGFGFRYDPKKLGLEPIEYSTPKDFEECFFSDDSEDEESENPDKE